MKRRTRGIPREFVERDSLAGLSRDARFTLLMLVTVCDDYGHTRARLSWLLGNIFTDDADARTKLPGWIGELMRAGEVRLYTVRGENFLALTAWEEYIGPDTRTGEQYPPPPDFERQPDLFDAGGAPLTLVKK